MPESPENYVAFQAVVPQKFLKPQLRKPQAMLSVDQITQAFKNRHRKSKRRKGAVSLTILQERSSNRVTRRTSGASQTAASKVKLDCCSDNNKPPKLNDYDLSNSCVTCNRTWCWLCPASYWELSFAKRHLVNAHSINPDLQATAYSLAYCSCGRLKDRNQVNYGKCAGCGKFYCTFPDCSKSYNSKNMVMNHRRLVHRKNILCTSCGVGSKNLASPPLLKWMRCPIQHCNAYWCMYSYNYCRKQFDSQAEVVDHLKVTHRIVPLTPQWCARCNEPKTRTPDAEWDVCPNCPNRHWCLMNTTNSHPVTPCPFESEDSVALGYHRSKVHKCGTRKLPPRGQ